MCQINLKQQLILQIQTTDRRSLWRVRIVFHFVSVHLVDVSKFSIFAIVKLWLNFFSTLFLSLVTAIHSTFYFSKYKCRVFTTHRTIRRFRNLVHITIQYTYIMDHSYRHKLSNHVNFSIVATKTDSFSTIYISH